MDELPKIQEWLHLTNQQHVIMQAIAALSNGQACKPRDVESEYKKLTGKSIQKTNVFGILKALHEKGLVRKDEKSNYRLDVQSIKKQLNHEKKILESQTHGIGQLLVNPGSILSRLDKHESDGIVVELINKKQLYEKLHVKLEACDEYYNISRYPSLFFTETLTKRLNRDRYVERMEERLRKGSLDVFYLTNLDITRPYNHALGIFKDKKSAKKETELSIERFGSLVRENDNLNICFSETKPDWEFIILSENYPREMFLVLRSTTGEESPAILHVISNEVAERAHRTMQRWLGRTERITRHNVEKYEKRLRGILKKI